MTTPRRISKKILKVVNHGQRWWKSSSSRGRRPLKSPSPPVTWHERPRNMALLMFCLSVAPSQIEEEVYVPLMTCNKCCAVEEHETRFCHKPSSYQVCSECGQEDHTFRDCRAAEKRCLHCGQNHSARAMRCPVRKRALREKTDLLKSEKTKPATYSLAASSAGTQPASDLSKISLKGVLCVLHAHMAEAATPGTFQRTLSEGLAMNGLPDVKLPQTVPSLAIIKRLTSDETSPHSSSSATHNPPPITQKPDSEDERAQSSDEEKDDSEEEDTEQGQQSQQPYDTPRIAVTVIKSNDDTWPSPLTGPKIHKGIQEGRFKVGHNGEHNATEDVLQWLKDTKGPFHRLCKSVEPRLFASLTNGPLPDHLRNSHTPRRTRSYRK